MFSSTNRASTRPTTPVDTQQPADVPPRPQSAPPLRRSSTAGVLGALTPRAHGPAREGTESEHESPAAPAASTSTSAPAATDARTPASGSTRRRTIEEGAEDILQGTIGLRSRMAATPARRDAIDVEAMLGETLEARAELFEEMGTAHPQTQQLVQALGAETLPPLGPAREFVETQGARMTSIAAATREMAALPPERQAAAATESLHGSLQRVLALSDTRIELDDAARRDFAAMTSFVETGRLPDEALAGPSTEMHAMAPTIPPAITPAVTPAITSTVTHVPPLRGADIPRVAQSLLPDVAAATSQQRSAAVALVLAQQLDLPGAAQGLQIAQTLANFMRHPGTPNLGAAMRQIRDTVGSGYDMVHRGLGALARNEFENPHVAAAVSVVNVGARNLPAVAGSTTARQMLSAQIERGLSIHEVSDLGRSMLGGTIMMLPVIALGMGAIRDHRHGTATPQSDFARLVMAGMSVAALLGGVFGGQLAGAASQLTAFALYTFMRDIVVQSHLRLHNPNSAHQAPNAHHWHAISWGYGIDQMLVNAFMPMAAPVSGPAAYPAHMGATEQFRAAAIRGAINWAGEVAEDLMFNGIGAFRANQPLRLGLREEPSLRHVTNGLLAPMAVRTAITHTNIILSDIIDSALGNDHPSLSLWLPAVAAGGVLNGVFYWPFANAGSGQPQHVPRARIEDAPAAAAADDDAPAHRITFPNVDMDDDRPASRQTHHPLDDPEGGASTSAGEPLSM